MHIKAFAVLYRKKRCNTLAHCCILSTNIHYSGVGRQWTKCPYKHSVRASMMIDAWVQFEDILIAKIAHACLLKFEPDMSYHIPEIKRARWMLHECKHLAHIHHFSDVTKDQFCMTINVSTVALMVQSLFTCNRLCLVDSINQSNVTHWPVYGTLDKIIS